MRTYSDASHTRGFSRVTLGLLFPGPYGAIVGELGHQWRCLLGHDFIRAKQTRADRAEGLRGDSPDPGARLGC